MANMLREVIRLNGLIIVIFIILYFAFRFLKAKDSQDNSGGYSRRPYNAGYPWNRVAPPEEDVPEHVEDESESYDAGSESEVEPYNAGSDVSEAEAPEAPEYVEKAAEARSFDVKADYEAPEIPVPKSTAPEASTPEAFGLRMPEPMSIPTTEIVIDSQVHVDTTLLQDKDKS